MFTEIFTHGIQLAQLTEKLYIHCVHWSASEATYQLMENQTVEKDARSTADHTETLTSYI
jgi:hypothetical protein